MNHSFIFKEITPAIEIMNGVFYDRDLDPKYSGEENIDERLSISTTKAYKYQGTLEHGGSNIYLKYGPNGFYNSSPITGINSNTQSVLLNPFCQLEHNAYFSEYDTDDDGAKYSYKEIYYDIKATDNANASTLSTLWLYLRAKNPVCTFDFTVTNFDFESGERVVIPDGGAINVDEKDDYFTLTFSKIRNTQDTDTWLANKTTVEELEHYIKLDRGAGWNNVAYPDRYSIHIPYFTTSIDTPSSQDEIVLRYTLNDLSGADSLGAFEIKPYMYNKMGVNEFIDNNGDPTFINNRSKDITATYTLMVAAAEVNIAAYTITNSSLLVYRTGYPGMPTTYSTGEETTSPYKQINFPFTITGASAYNYTIKATVTPNGGQTPIVSQQIPCNLSLPSPNNETTHQSGYLEFAFNYEKDYSDVTGEVINGFVGIRVKKYWSGAFTLVVKAEILGQVLGTPPIGQDTQTWNITIEDVNQSPTLLIDPGTAPTPDVES